MHFTAMRTARLFFETYARDMKSPTIVDIGAQDVNGSLKEVAPPGCNYVGVDFVAGRGVDVVLDDPYVLPFESGSVDIVVSSSVLEHSELFWVLYLEMLRIVKPGGLLYVNAPSNGYFHRHPVDCWRFYPDSGRALVAWAKRNGMTPELLESYVGRQASEDWSDFVAVFVKDAAYADRFPARMVDATKEFSNATVLGRGEMLNPRPITEDQALLRRTLAYHLKRFVRSFAESRAR